MLHPTTNLPDAPLSRSGRFSFIVQLPLVSSSRMVSVRDLLRRGSDSLYVIPFDDRPGKLFDGLEHCRSTVFLFQARQHANALTTSGYHRWLTEAREYLFSGLEFVAVLDTPIYPQQFPKYETLAEETVFHKVKGSGRMGAHLSPRPTNAFIFYQEATGYWVKATIGLPFYAKNGTVGAPAHGRYLYFNDPRVAASVCALLNSSLFYAYFIAYGDCFHLGDGLVSDFPVLDGLLDEERLVRLGHQLMDALLAGSETKTIRTKDGDTIAYAEFYGWKAKPIIDEIDRVLAEHYGFTAEELDFIVNYDIKYRMGADNGEGDAGENGEE